VMSTDPSADPTASTSARLSVDAAVEAEASGNLVAMSFPGARRIAGWLFWVVFPLACLAAIWLSVSSLVAHLGHQPPGIKGEFVGGRNCSHGVCLVSGTFTSDNGKVTVTSLLGDPRWKVGEKHRVVYDGKSAEISAITEWDPTTAILAAAGAVTYLGVVVYIARATRRDTRD
jgi:hypothetical protein